MAAGIYPYFRVIGSDQDTEVTINGKSPDVWIEQLSRSDQPSKIKEASKPLINMVPVVLVHVFKRNSGHSLSSKKD